MDTFLHDVRYAARGLARRPGFAAITVLTLGVGVGVLTAFYAVVHAVLMRPLVPDQERVVRIWKHDVERGLGRHPLSYHEFEEWRDNARSVEALAAINYADAMHAALIIDGQPSRAVMTPVSRGFFEMLLRAEPLHGRWLQAVDEQPGAEFAAVVSHRFWRRVAAGDPSLVGRRIMWAGGDRSLIVVGIAPPDLDYPLGSDMWVPIAKYFATDGVMRFDIASRQFAQFELLGRLAPGASPEDVHAELTVLHRRLTNQYAGDYDPMHIVVTPLLDTVVGDGRRALRFIFAAAALVFVIAGVNVAALLLMRAASRRREAGVRVALGATQTRLARAAIVESVLLGGLAAAAGVFLAVMLLAVVRWLAPPNLPRIEQASLDSQVLGFCVLAVFVWVLALGTAPVWIQRRRAATSPSHLSELSSRSTRATKGLRMFPAAQVAAAVIVAVGAGLLLRSMIHLQRIDRGFDPSNIAVLPLLLPESRYADVRTRLAFYEQLLPALESVPGVVAASPLHVGPGSGAAGLSAGMRFEGQTEAEAAKNPWASWEPVTPSYFQTLGIAIVRGRGFNDADRADAAPVAIVSEAVARRYWPGMDPIGKRVQFMGESPWATVVGVAADLRYRELTRTWLTVYFPAAQFFFFSPNTLLVRTASAPQAFVPAIRQTIRTQEPHAAVGEITTMEALASKELSRPRAALAVTTLFALVAILLAAIGIYSVMSYEVTERRYELAIRSALGASPKRLFRGVVGQSLGLAAAGAVAGLVTASVVTRSLESLLFEVRPGDPRMFAVAAGILLLVVALASLLPARRAARADPAAVLRAE